MNKRKIISILALCVCAILIVMTSVPDVYGGSPLWGYLFDDDFVAVGVLSVIFTIAAIVLAVLALIYKNRAKLFNTLSIAITWVNGTTITFFGHYTTAYYVSSSCYLVLCVPILIWNLALKDRPAQSSAQPSAIDQSAHGSGLFGVFSNKFTTFSALDSGTDISATTAESISVNYITVAAKTKREKIFEKDEAVKKYFDSLTEYLCKRSAENSGDNAFVNSTEIEKLFTDVYKINFNKKDKAVRKNKENKQKLKKFNKTLKLFERHQYNDARVEIGMPLKDHEELKAKIDAIAQEEIKQLCIKIKPEIESLLKKQRKLNLSGSEKLQLLARCEAERFFATLSQETDDCLQRYEEAISVALFGFASEVERLNEKFGASNGCVRSAIASVLIDLYVAANETLKTMLGEFFGLQLKTAFASDLQSDMESRTLIPTLYTVVARSLNYKKFKGKSADDYTELSDEECNAIINGLLLRTPHGKKLTADNLREYRVKSIIDDSNVGNLNGYEFEDVRDPLYRLNVICEFINKYIINNNYLVNSIYLMDGSLAYCYDKLCEKNESVTDASEDTVTLFETMLANINYGIRQFSGKDIAGDKSDAREKRRAERIILQEEAERLRQQRLQEEALTAPIRQAEEQRRFNEQQANEQRRFNEQQANEQRRQAEEQRKLMQEQMNQQKKLAERQACAAGACPNCSRQCGMINYSPNGLGGCLGFIKK